MRVPAIVLIALLVVAAAGLHFLFFGPYANQWEKYSQDLDTYRAEYLKVVGKADDPTRIAVMARQVQQKNAEYRQKIQQISAQYQIQKATFEAETDLEQEVLDRLRRLEQLETSAARLKFDEPTARPSTRITVLKEWGIGGDLQEESNGNRFLRPTAGNIRIYAAGPSRISTASGSIDVMVRPIGWNGADDTQQRIILYAQGGQAGVGRVRPGTLSTIQLTKTPGGRLEYSLSNPTDRPLTRSADVRTWEEGEWHRVTITWSKSPAETELYIDGTRSAQFEARALPASPSTRRSSAGTGMTGMYERLRELYGRRVPTTGIGHAAPAIRGSLQLETVPLPHVIDRIVLGGMENTVQETGVDIDNFAVLNRPLNESEMSGTPQWSGDEVLLSDNFQTPYGDIRLLESTLSDMRGCLQLINEQEANLELKQKKEEEYQLLKKSIGVEDDKLSELPPQTRYLVQVLLTDQIHRMVGGTRTLEEVKKILRVPRLTTGDKKGERTLKSIIGFLNLTLEMVDKAEQNQLAQLSSVTILGESSAASDKDLMAQFQRYLQDLREELSNAASSGAETSRPTTQGASPTGAQRPMPASPYGGGYYPMPAAPAYGYPPTMYPPAYGYPPTMYPPAYGYPPTMYPPAYGYPPSMYAPASPVPVYDAASAAQAREYLEKMNRLRRYELEFARGVIPADARARLAEAEKEEGFYTRRLLRLKVLGKIDYLPQFLYDLEFKDRLATIQAIGMERESKDLIACTVSVDIHYVSPKRAEQEPEEGSQAGSQPQ